MHLYYAYRYAIHYAVVKYFRRGIGSKITGWRRNFGALHLLPAGSGNSKVNGVAGIGKQQPARGIRHIQRQLSVLPAEME